MANKLSEELERKAQELARIADKTADEAEALWSDMIENSFSGSAFSGGGSKWAARKKEDAGRQLLVKSGDMKRHVNQVTRSSSVNGVVLSFGGSGNEYAAVHNEGLQAGREGGFIMPQRKFAPVDGEEPPFSKELEDYIDRKMNELLG
jgi:phage gpG-like protein